MENIPKQQTNVQQLFEQEEQMQKQQLQQQEEMEEEENENILTNIMQYKFYILGGIVGLVLVYVVYTKYDDIKYMVATPNSLPENIVKHSPHISSPPVLSPSSPPHPSLSDELANLDI